MTRLVAAELLKLRTTRAWLVYVPILVLVCVLGAAAQLGDADETGVGSAELSLAVLETALFATFVGFLVGVTAVTAEWRHGTLTRTFLVEPRRPYVLGAKAAAGVLVACTLALLAIGIVVAVGASWTSFESVGFQVDGELVGRMGRILLVAALWGALGVCVGALVQSQTPALVGAILWFLLVEALVGALLGVLDAEGVADFLPGAALSALDGSEEGGLEPWAGGAVALGWVAVLGTLGGLRMARRDVT